MIANAMLSYPLSYLTTIEAFIVHIAELTAEFDSLMLLLQKVGESASGVCVMMTVAVGMLYHSVIV